MESEGEIEYLDEDEDIVQQCIQVAEQSVIAPLTQGNEIDNKPKSLLIERKETPKKRKHEDDSSDYDPTEDLKLLKHKKAQATVKNASKYGKTFTPPPKTKINKTITSKEKKVTFQPTPKPQINKPVIKEKKLDVRIPDYDDPLCLPVKLVNHDDINLNRLKIWNNLCLEKLKTADQILKPTSGNGLSSKRTLVLKNVKGKNSANVDLSVWSKTTVANGKGDAKSEVYQCVLPLYKEKAVLDYNIPQKRVRRGFKTVNTVVLTKENYEDEEVLVAYNPLEAKSSVYKLINISEEQEETDASNPTMKQYLEEKAECKICAPCYQASCRPTKCKGGRNVACAVCSRTFLSVHNFLTHVRSHPPQLLRAHRRKISAALAQIVDYHYRCRICQKSFLSIPETRKHVAAHKSKEQFLCQVGNHLTQ